MGCCPTEMTPMLPFPLLIILVPLVAIVAGVYAFGRPRGRYWLPCDHDTGRCPGCHHHLNCAVVEHRRDGGHAAAIRLRRAIAATPSLAIPCSSHPGSVPGGPCKSRSSGFSWGLGGCPLGASIVMFVSAGKTAEIIDYPAPALESAVALPRALLSDSSPVSWESEGECSWGRWCSFLLGQDRNR